MVALPSHVCWFFFTHIARHGRLWILWARLHFPLIDFPPLLSSFLALNLIPIVFPKTLPAPSSPALGIICFFILFLGFFLCARFMFFVDYGSIMALCEFFCLLVSFGTTGFVVILFLDFSRVV